MRKRWVTVAYTHPISVSYNDPISVSYNGNENDSGEAPPTQFKAKGEIVVIYGNTGNLSHDGYIFSGWNTAADGSGTAYAGGDSYALDIPTLLYAQWQHVAVLSHLTATAWDFYARVFRQFGTYSQNISGEYEYRPSRATINRVTSDYLALYPNPSVSGNETRVGRMTLELHTSAPNLDSYSFRLWGGFAGFEYDVLDRLGTSGPINGVFYIVLTYTYNPDPDPEYYMPEYYALSYTDPNEMLCLLIQSTTTYAGWWVTNIQQIYPVPS